MSVFNRQLPSIAPFSILPTLIAVGVSLWWGAIDSTLRRLQPYISMVESPKRFSQGANLSYESSYWVHAAAKAAFNRHWFLSLLTFGTFLCSVFTISMSALFQRGPGAVYESSEIERGLELRQIPFVFLPKYPSSPHQQDESQQYILANLYANLSTNWMYSATVQLAFDGSEPAWSQDGWSFVPLDLSQIPAADASQPGDGSLVLATKQATVTTPGIRARVECKPYSELSNTSAWLTTWDLRNTSSSPGRFDDLTLAKVYELGADDGKYDGTSPPDSMYFFDTTFLGSPFEVVCCATDTHGIADGSVIGYWSQKTKTTEGYFKDFTTKWIYGSASEIYDDTLEQPFLFFRDIPKVQALHCTPIIEKATAKVTVSQSNGKVQSFDILDKPVVAEEAWKDAYRTWARFPGLEFDFSNNVLNTTVSYGVLFRDAVLAASYVATTAREEYSSDVSENLEDSTFNYRDTKHGLNLDFMSFAMFSAAEKDPTALLNKETMEKLASKTFSVFFQHYVSSNVSIEDGGWAYQPINASLPSDIGAGQEDTKPEELQPPSHTDRKAIVDVSWEVEMLQTSPIAVWLSVSILVWLIVTALIIAVVLRKQLKRLGRDVECIADVLLLVAGSERLIKLLRENGPSGLDDDEGRLMAGLGWFETNDGVARWGIEIFEQEEGDGDTESHA